MVFFQQLGTPKNTQYRDDSEPAKPIVHTIVVETIEDNQRPIKREIKKFYRTEDGNFYYSETLEGEDWQGNTINHSRVVGKFKTIVFKRHHNRQTGTTTVTGVRDFVDSFEIPFTPEGKFTDPSTGLETTLDGLFANATRDHIFYIKTFQRLYALRNVTWEEFKTKSVEDLTYRGIHGKWPDVEAPRKKKANADE